MADYPRPALSIQDFPAPGSDALNLVRILGPMS